MYVLYPKHACFRIETCTYVLYPKHACFRIETYMFSIQNMHVLGSKHVCLSQKHACLWWKHLCLSLKLACLGLKHSSYLSKTCMFCIEIMHVLYRDHACSLTRIETCLSQSKSSTFRTEKKVGFLPEIFIQISKQIYFFSVLWNSKFCKTCMFGSNKRCGSQRQIAYILSAAFVAKLISTLKFLYELHQTFSHRQKHPCLKNIQVLKGTENMGSGYVSDKRIMIQFLNNLYFNIYRINIY